MLLMADAAAASYGHADRCAMVLPDYFARRCYENHGDAMPRMIMFARTEFAMPRERDKRAQIPIRLRYHVA